MRTKLGAQQVNKKKQGEKGSNLKGSKIIKTIFKNLSNGFNSTLNLKRAEDLTETSVKDSIILTPSLTSYHHL